MVLVKERISAESLEENIQLARNLLSHTKNLSEELLMKTELSLKEKEIKAYNIGLIKGTEKVFEKLIDQEKISTKIEEQIKELIINVTKEILTEVLAESIKKDKFKILENRILKFLPSALNILKNNLSTTVKILIPNGCLEQLTESVIKKDAQGLLWQESEEIADGSFRLVSAYGQIDSDPNIHFEKILENFKENLTLSVDNA